MTEIETCEDGTEFVPFEDEEEATSQDPATIQDVLATLRLYIDGVTAEELPGLLAAIEIIETNY